MVARIIPPEKLPCAWAGTGATTRMKRSTATEDPREGAKERVQNGSTESQGVGQTRGPRRTGAQAERL